MPMMPERRKLTVHFNFQYLNEQAIIILFRCVLKGAKFIYSSWQIIAMTCNYLIHLR